MAGAAVVVVVVVVVFMVAVVVVEVVEVVVAVVVVAAVLVVVELSVSAAVGGRSLHRLHVRAQSVNCNRPGRQKRRRARSPARPGKCTALRSSSQWYAADGSSRHPAASAKLVA